MTNGKDEPGGHPGRAGRRLPPVATVRAQRLGIDDLGAGVARVRLRLPADHPIERLAGQYLEIRDGEDAWPFSIASPPESGRDIELHIGHGPDNPASLAVMALLAREPVVELRLPLGECTLDAEPRLPLLFIAGGTGFAPVKAFVEHAIAQRFRVPVTVCWGARSAAGLYLRELPERWAREHENIRFVPALSGVDDAGCDAGPAGVVRGLVHEAALATVQDFGNLLVYACGSPPMVHAAYDAFVARGLPPARMLSDVFAWAPRDAG